MKPLLNIEEHTSEILPHEPVITTKNWQERFDEMSEIEEFWGLPYDYLVDEAVKNFISDLIDQTREETIDFDEELLEIGIQRILEPYFVVLDGRDNEPANETVIEISRRIISKTKQSLKSLINK